MISLTDFCVGLQLHFPNSRMTQFKNKLLDSLRKTFALPESPFKSAIIDKTLSAVNRRGILVKGTIIGMSWNTNADKFSPVENFDEVDFDDRDTD